jgi:hypothetical protein
MSTAQARRPAVCGRRVMRVRLLLLASRLCLPPTRIHRPIAHTSALPRPAHLSTRRERRASRIRLAAFHALPPFVTVSAGPGAPRLFPAAARESTAPLMSAPSPPGPSAGVAPAAPAPSQTHPPPLGIRRKRPTHLTLQPTPSAAAAAAAARSAPNSPALPLAAGSAASAAAARSGDASSQASTSLVPIPAESLRDTLRGTPRRRPSMPFARR